MTHLQALAQLLTKRVGKEYRTQTVSHTQPQGKLTITTLWNNMEIQVLSEHERYKALGGFLNLREIENIIQRELV